MSTNNNLQILTKLSEEEKQEVKNIIKEISSNGKSEQLLDLYYDDYEEIPVDIDTFLEDERYLGSYTNHGKDIFPKWREELRVVHNPINAFDEWAITGSIRNR